MNDIFAVRRRLLAAGVCSALAPALALGQPDLSRKLGPTIADTGSATYRFERLALRSADGERSYRVQIGIPRRAAPPQGYPFIVLLDGNAALASIDETLLQTLDVASPPVIVAIGYDTDLRFDVKARAYDYTPPIPAGQADEEAGRGRKGGGADVFLALIAHEILPRVRALAPLDAARSNLWGHSYGGLFVLHTLFKRAELFRHYLAASPSLWWQRGVILDEERQFAQSTAAVAQGTQLWVMVGESEGRERRERPAPSAQAGAGSDTRAQSMLASRASMPADALPKMLARLRRHAGLVVSDRIFPGLAHGPMLPASLVPALRLTAGLTPFDAGT